MEIDQLYTRRDDMSEDGIVTLQMQDDGDIILAIKTRPFRYGHLMSLSLEFCLDAERSPHTRQALKALAEAIELDNSENPIS